MGLTRWGMVLLGIGLLAGTLSALFGVSVAGPAVDCPPDRAFTLVFEGVVWESATVAYQDGCATRLLNPGITVGTVLAATGVVIGGIGIATNRRTEG